MKINCINHGSTFATCACDVAHNYNPCMRKMYLMSHNDSDIPRATVSYALYALLFPTVATLERKFPVSPERYFPSCICTDYLTVHVHNGRVSWTHTFRKYR